jgi:processive 1,2-diacylglycerol beta-glucosyltransferase
MSELKRLLIVSVNAGAGHLRAAQALEVRAREMLPGAEVVNCDALEYANPTFRKNFTATYLRLAKNLPSLWRMIYEKLEKQSAKSKVKRLSELSSRWNTPKFAKFVKRFDPDAIICTHYLPAEVLGSRLRKGKLRARLSMVLTDYDIHTMWVQSAASEYFVATDEMAYALRAKGVADAGVTVSGIPVLGDFAADYPARNIMRQQLGMNPKPPTVLLAAGGFGSVPLAKVAELLIAETENVQFITLAGKNAKLLKKCEAVAAKHPGRIIPLGYANNMHELMAASDFIVTKCGGLTSSECLAMGVPMVIINPIPGQEERNADFLLESGAAVRANSLAHLVFKVRMLLNDPARLRTMRAAALKAGKPDAADTIIRAVMDG